MLGILVATALSASPKLQLATLPTPDDCGCAVYDGKKTVFFEPIEAKATIVLDGKKRELTKGKDTTPEKKPKVGDTFFKEYSGGDVSLRMDHTVTFVCKDSDESCEVAKFKVTVTVTQGDQSRTYKNLKAECGC